MLGDIGLFDDSVYERGIDSKGGIHWQGLTVLERFYMSYKRNEDTGCWEWSRAKDTMGYGRLLVDGHRVGAHRFSWSYFNKMEIPEGMGVQHICNVKSCVNPDHLEIGTQKRNIQNSVRDGLHPMGKRSTASKFCDDQVRLIRSVVGQGLCSQALCAEVYGVSPMTISSMVRRKTWKHVPD